MQAARLVVLTRDRSSYGLRLLEALDAAGLRPAGVVVARDTIARRWRMLRAVARRIGWAEALHAAIDAQRTALPRHRTRHESLCERVVRVDSFHDPAAIAALGALDADWFLLGQPGILKPQVLALARHGVLNAHPGWLPDYRGLSPATWALASGEPQRLGSTLHLVDAGIDTGAIVALRPLERRDLPPFHALEARLYDDCIALLVDAAARLRRGEVLEGRPQRAEAGRTYSVAPREVRRRARRAYGSWAARAGPHGVPDQPPGW